MSENKSLEGNRDESAEGFLIEALEKFPQEILE